MKIRGPCQGPEQQNNGIIEGLFSILMSFKSLEIKYEHEWLCREKLSVKTSNDYRFVIWPAFQFHMHNATLCSSCKIAVIYTCLEKKVMMEADLVRNAKLMHCSFEITSHPLRHPLIYQRSDAGSPDSPLKFLLAIIFSLFTKSRCNTRRRMLIYLRLIHWSKWSTDKVFKAFLELQSIFNLLYCCDTYTNCKVLKLYRSEWEWTGDHHDL